MTILEAKHINRIDYVSGFFISLRQSYAAMRETLGELEARKGYDRCIFRLIDDYVSAAAEGYISSTDFIALMNAVNDWKVANDGYFARKEVPNALEEKVVNRDVGMVGREAKVYQDEYRLGCILTPDNLDEFPLLAPRRDFVAPVTVPLMDYCLPTKDQGRLPWCAAFSAVDFASNILWRKNDYPTEFSPEPIYRKAKEIDGMPNADGTSLVAVLQSLLDSRIFDPAKSEVKVLRTVDQVKYAVHKFGCCLVGLNISKEWYDCNKHKNTICGEDSPRLIGGHAVLVCGYLDKYVIIHNSWGVDWGSYGFAYITWQEFEREFMYGAVLDNCLYEMRMN